MYQVSPTAIFAWPIHSPQIWTLGPSDFWAGEQAANIIDEPSISTLAANLG
jgi:hypothetical protein